MADCELLKGCPFFNDKMDNMPAISNMFKEKYCKGDKSKCARYMIFKTLGREKVPSNLLPNQTSVANDIIKKG